jgi:hypothetical protein
MWMAPIGHAPHDWHPPSVKTDDGDDDESAAVPAPVLATDRERDGRLLPYLLIPTDWVRVWQRKEEEGTVGG